jgi:magnesium transporter
MATATPHLTTRLYCRGDLTEIDFDPARIDQALEDRDNLVWLDVAGSPEEIERSIPTLRDEFGFHELALEDCIHPHQRPKIEQYDTYFFLVAYGTSAKGDELVKHEMAIFVGRNYLVTVRKDPAFDLGPVLKRWDAHSELAAEGGGYLLYILLDEVVDGYFDELDRYQDRTEDIEELVFGASDQTEAHSHIFRLRKELVVFRRFISPLREVLDVIQRRTTDVVTERLEPYYRDVYDHVLRATDFLDAIRDILSSALETNLVAVSNRLNEVMKNLSSWAAIILVPTLIAGIYGMNFRHMPELNWLFGYPFALGLMLTSGLILYRVFKRRGWL